MTESLKRILKRNLYDGVSGLTDLIAPEKVQRIVWVASYPRSGNTWLRYTLCKLYDIVPDQCGDTDGYNTDVIDRAAEIEVAEGKVKFIKTHAAPLPHYTMAWDYGTRIRTHGFIYIYRHPLDVFLSSLNYVHKRNMVRVAFDGRPQPVEELARSGELARYADAFIEDMSIGTGAFRTMCGGNWDQHVLRWKQLHDSGRYRSVVLRYEEMVADPLAALEPFRQILGVDQAALARALDASADATKADGGFFWRKQAGGYREFLSDEQVERFHNRWGSLVRDLGYGALP